MEATSELRAGGSFEMTADDLRETLSPPPGAAPKAKTRKRVFFGWLLFLALSMLLYSWLSLHSPQPAPMPPQAQWALASRNGSMTIIPAGTADFWLTLLPSLTVALAVTFLTFSSLRATRRRRAGAQAAPRQGSAGAGILAVLGVGLVVLGLYLASHPPFEVRWRPDGFQATLLALAPWFILFLALALFLRPSRISRRQYAATPGLRRRRSIGLDESGYRVDDGVIASQYRWPHFTRAWETENVLVLVDEFNRRHTLAKRAFATAQELQTAMALIVTYIPDSKLLIQPGGFEVAPPPPQAPLPVIPITSPAPAPDQAQG